MKKEKKLIEPTVNGLASSYLAMVYIGDCIKYAAKLIVKTKNDKNR